MAPNLFHLDYAPVPLSNVHKDWYGRYLAVEVHKHSSEWDFFGVFGPPFVPTV